ncbi:Penicillin-binding protein 1A [Serratia fonticola]|uniref:Penicillin-binding protein 1A n=1 Tax=Serratia fonticola TaxID=47917 RepID=A0A4U9WRI9_SERFO|nr:Penicillin-binding protein 1A [Serratia fonticola]
MIKRYGENAYTDGYKVYTTITKRLQQGAQEAVRNNILNYDMRHGYRGPSNVLWKVGEPAWDQKQIVDSLKNLPNYGPLSPAVILQADAEQATAMLADGSRIALPMSGMRWARAFKSDTVQGPTPKRVTDVGAARPTDLGA